MSVTLPFTKMHGAGNDFVMLDGRVVPAGWLTSARIAALCDRRRGIGAEEARRLLALFYQLRRAYYFLPFALILYFLAGGYSPTKAAFFVILATFVLGLGTRKVSTALQPILGEPVSASTVSRVARALDAAVAAFHKRPLKEGYRFLILDGVAVRNFVAILNHSRKAKCLLRDFLRATYRLMFRLSQVKHPL